MRAEFRLEQSGPRGLSAAYFTDCLRQSIRVALRLHDENAVPDGNGCETNEHSPAEKLFLERERRGMQVMARNECSCASGEQGEIAP
jgi:hypothetical protein